LIFLQLAIHVSLLAMQAIERVLQMSDISSHSYWKQLANLSQDGLSWKMLEDISASDSKKFLQALPKSGMTQDGKLFELVRLERLTKEQDYSLLPTPLASDAKISYVTRSQISLSTVLLPTPTAMHTRNHDEPIEAYQSRVKDYEMGKTKGKPGMSTGIAVRLLPTPTTQEGSGQCRDFRADLTHAAKCLCKQRRIHWMNLED
jgi:hypothetical protein